ncbi:transposase family protein [Streptomyces brasiliensis]|uniref:transposase family protein n=1 Tax=Streptomyces brasiliensis TaxID=1954 RepID=UPI003570BA6C
MSCDAHLGPCGLFPSCPVRGLSCTLRRVARRTRPEVGSGPGIGVAERRGGDRRRAARAWPKQRLEFIDRLLATLVHLRLGLSHAALAQLYGLDLSCPGRSAKPATTDRSRLRRPRPPGTATAHAGGPVRLRRC